MMVMICVCVFASACTFWLTCECNTHVRRSVWVCTYVPVCLCVCERICPIRTPLSSPTDSPFQPCWILFSLSGEPRPASGSPCYDRGYNNRPAIPLLSAAFRRGNLPRAQINYNTRALAHARAHRHTRVHARTQNRLQPPKQNIFQNVSSWLMKQWQEEKYNFWNGKGKKIPPPLVKV